MSNTVTIHINGRAVEAVRDGDKLVIEVAGRKVRIPMDAKGVLSVPKQGRPTLESTPPEPTEAMVDATKLRAVREAAKRPATPRNARESYLRARHAAAVRDAHTMGFRCGFAEGQSKLLGAPLADRITDADADQLLELVMQVVLDNEELRAGYRMACDLVDGDDVGSADVVAPPAPVEPTPVAPLVEPTIADLIASIDEAVGEQVSFATETVIEPVPMVEVPEAPFVAPEAAQAPKAVATRSAWNGSVTFGLVNVPVKLYQQFGDHGLDLHTCHASDGGKLKWLKVCDCCGESGISTTETGKKVSGADVWLTAEEVKSTQSTAPAEFCVDQFVDAGEIDLSLTERQFSVRADKKGDRGYSLLVDALRSTGKVAVGRIVLRTVESIAVLRVVEGELVVSTLKWADQVRDLGLEAPVEAAYNDTEYQTALDLIGAMSGKFSHGEYSDPQQARITELLEAKAA